MEPKNKSDEQADLNPAGVSPDSPCINICRIDHRNRLCSGCFRTLAEITAWQQLSDEAKIAINAVLPRRKRTAGAT